MRNRIGADKLDTDHIARGLLLGFFNGRGHLVSLAIAPADLALAVADDDQGREAEAASALHHRGAALDLDRLVDELATVFTIFGCHVFSSFPGSSLGTHVPEALPRCRFSEAEPRASAVPGGSLGPSCYLAVPGTTLEPSLVSKSSIPLVSLRRPVPRRGRDTCNGRDRRRLV